MPRCRSIRVGGSAWSAPTAAASRACSRCCAASCTPRPATARCRATGASRPCPRKPLPLRRPAIEFVLDGDSELRQVEQALTAADAAHDGHALAELHARLEGIDGYAARARAAGLLAGLGFATTDLERPVSDFSGGWRMRLNLAQALLSRADLMLLDEPTNHLDLDAVVWLERWLANYRGTLLLVSHDRDFLDAAVTHVANLERGLLTLYTGQLFVVRGPACRTACRATGDVRKAAARNRPHDAVRGAVPGQGVESAAGTEPPQGPGSPGAHRCRARRRAVRFRIPGAGPRTRSAAGAGRRDGRLPGPRRARSAATLRCAPERASACSVQTARASRR